MTYESFCGKEKAEKVLLKVLRIDFFKQNSCTFLLCNKIILCINKIIFVYKDEVRSGLSYK